MTKKRIKRMFFIIIKYSQEPYFRGAGAQIAFYLIMSLVPLSILFAQLCGVFAISGETIQGLLDHYLKTEAANTLIQLLPGYNGVGSGAFRVVAIFLALWAASKVQFCIVGISNYVYSGNLRVHSFIRERIMSIVNVILLLLLVVASLIVLVYGELILNMVELYAEKFIGLTLNFNGLWYLLRWPVAIAVYVVIISYVYYSSPMKKVPYRQIIPGSFVASGGMLIASFAYSIYVTVFANFNVLYGSLASLVALMFWFYILGSIFVLGILVNVAWFETRNVR